MEKRKDTSAKRPIEGTSRIEKQRTPMLVQQIRALLEQQNIESALTLFNELHPADQGEVLVNLASRPQHELLSILPPEETAEILEHLEPEEAAQVSEGIEPSALPHVLDETSPDVAADILRQLPEEQSQDILGAMEEAKEVMPLLQYSDDSAGGLMTPRYMAVREDITAGNALDILRLRGPNAKDPGTVFTVDAQGQLTGSLSIGHIALARPNTLVNDIVERDVISIASETDQEECARVMEHYDLNQLPVVDATGQLIGIILSEDVIDVVEEEATEDMYKMAGIAGERIFGPLRSSVRRRLPWLTINLATAFLAAGVISIFESTIAQVVALAVFLPVVASQGGIGGTQTLTLVIRSIALGEVAKRRGRHLLAREIALSLIHGLLLGMVVGLVAYIWKGTYMLGVILGLALLGNMLVAGLAGAGVPLLLRRLRIDPAVASAVIVTTFTDVLGFLLFLGLATTLITFLL